MNENNFTPSQVGTILETLDKKIDILIEDMRGEFRAVTEVVLPLREDMAEVKTRLGKVEFRLTCFGDAVQVAVPSLTRRVSALEAKAG